MSTAASLNLARRSLKTVITAMRKGMTKTYARHGAFYVVPDRSSKGKRKCGACAVGAMVIGMGKKMLPDSGLMHDPSFSVHLISPIDFINRYTDGIELSCPATGCWSFNREYDFPVGTLADHMFEQHVIPRWKIAAYLEQQLRQHNFAGTAA